MTSQREPYAHKAEGGPDPFARAQEDARRRLPPGGGPIFNSVPPVIRSPRTGGFIPGSGRSAR